MKKLIGFIGVMAFLLVAWPNPARAQGYVNITEANGKAIPSSFIIGAEEIPVQEKNTVVLKTGTGQKVVLGMLNTTSSPPRIRAKFSGFITTEARISVCGISSDPGRYAFGLWAPKAPSKDNGKFTLYDKEGNEISTCEAKYEGGGADAKPLTVTAKGGPAKVTFFQYSIELK